MAEVRLLVFADPCVNNPDTNHPSCQVRTEHAPGGTPTALAPNGIRVCGAASSSTVGWGGEPDRAIDGKHCSEYGDGSCTHTDGGGAGDAERHSTGEPAWWQVRVRCCLLCIYMPEIHGSLSDCRSTSAAQRPSSVLISGTAQAAEMRRLIQ